MSYDAESIVRSGTLGTAAITDRSITANKVGVFGSSEQTNATMGELITITKDCSADGATLTFYIFNANCPFGVKVLDVVVECNVSTAGTSLTVLNGTNAITGSIVCQTNHAITKAGSIDDAYQVIGVGGTLKVVKSDVAGGGIVTIHAVRVVA